MSDTAKSRLEKAFQEARTLDAPLEERLALIANTVRDLDPSFSEAIDKFVTRLANAGAGDQAPKVGDEMPGFMLPDDQGHLVWLDKLLETAPVIIAFLRGHWCTYCRVNAAGLSEIEDELHPVRIVAITAETQAFTREIKAESGARFPFLTDFANGYALSLNLAVWVDDKMSSLIAGAGWDIPKYQGQDGWILPIPSVFVVGQDGLIKARHVDPDYRQRMDLRDLLAAAKAALA